MCRGPCFKAAGIRQGSRDRFSGCLRYRGDARYFASLVRYLADPKTPHVILHHLLHGVDLSDYEPMRDLPRTDELLDQKLQSLRREPVAAWLLDCW